MKPPRTQRPNILLISADMLRYDAVGANGNPLVRTPHLDALAAGGLRFSRAYCSHAVCMPCRASILTGRYPTSHGVWSNGVPLRETEITLSAELGRAGYATECYGKTHFRPWLPGFEKGREPATEYAGEGPYYGFERVRVVDHSDGDCFSDWVRANHPQWADRVIHHWTDRPADKPAAWKASYPAEATKTDYIANQTIEALGRHRGSDRPFFIWASFIDPHIPWAPPKPFADWHDDVEFPPPPALEGMPADKPSPYPRPSAARLETVRAEWQTVRRMYQGKVSHVDDRIGRILAALADRGLADRTMLIFLSDHGCLLGEFGLLQAGGKPLEATSHIPLIWSGPGLAGGRVSDGLASVIDVMPTVLDFAGVAVPAGVQGQSLRPVLEGRAERVREELLIEGCTDGETVSVPSRCKTLVAGPYKLALYLDPDEGELYNLAEDPQELRNLFGRPETAAIQRDLTERLTRRIIRSQDPLPLRVAPW